MKNIVGTPARKENFFKRDSEIAKIQERIDAGNNIQIAAPRRIGKTSLLFYLMDNNISGHLYVYVDTERVDDEQDFYRKLLKEILKIDSIAGSIRLRKLWEEGRRFLTKIKSIKVMGQGIDFHETDDNVDYYEEITNFLSGFELDDERKLVLLIDEFPQTILNLIDNNNGETRQAIKFLQSNRELRLNPNVNEKVRFIYTGSIGLNHTVASISATKFVNDLNSIEVEPLNHREALSLIRNLLEEKQVNIDDKTVEYLLEKIEWLIPFHIQLALHEISSLCQQNQNADDAVVDKAFDNMVASRNDNHYEHYYSRLKTQFKKETFEYADAILQQLAETGVINTGQLYDAAVKYAVQDQFRAVIEILVYDGYINNTGNPNIYQFNSPVVRLWWQKFICK